MNRRIYITLADKNKILKLIDDAELDIKNKDHIRDLNAELSRAEIVDIKKLPSKVITMNSRVLLSLDGLDEEVSLVYPDEANVSENLISVLSPIGTAILGYSEGDMIEWKVPSGVTTIKVKQVLYQPEAAEKLETN